VVGADRDAVAVSVRDYGTGLSSDEVAMVFNRFWRADPARARTTGGTGLGLAIALEDAHLHGGWLEVWGSPGEGANFRLTLPRRAGVVLTSSPLPLVPGDASGRPGEASRERQASTSLLPWVQPEETPVEDSESDPSAEQHRAELDAGRAG
jgi:two-component system sensor histidine kinase MtrB